MTRILSTVAVILLAIPLLAQEPPAPPAPPTAPPPLTKADLEPLSKMIRDTVLKQAPKTFEDNSAWNLSKPIPPKVRLPGLPRTMIRVGDHDEVAHGPWRRVKAWMADPEKDLTVEVTSLKPLPDGKYRLSITSTADLQVEGEFQQWLNGLMLVGITGRATTTAQTDVDADVKLTLDITKFPPEVTAEPKVVKLKVDLKKFELFKPQGGNAPPPAGGLNNDLKNLLQQAIRAKEPKLMEEANKAIADALKQGKGTFSAAKLYEAIPQPKKAP
jgi:hypothetical protein